MTTIPESIMREAREIYVRYHKTSLTQVDLQGDIARALQAAEERGRQEERERCANLAFDEMFHFADAIKARKIQQRLLKDHGNGN